MWSLEEGSVAQRVIHVGWLWIWGGFSWKIGISAKIVKKWHRKCECGTVILRFWGLLAGLSGHVLVVVFFSWVGENQEGF
jgi:hypothetical protein